MATPSPQTDEIGVWTSVATKVMGLSADFSLEITPGDIGHVPAVARRVPAGTRVYITHLPGPGLAGSTAAALALAAAGLRPVPHIAARALSSEAELDDALSLMVAEAGVEEVLVIGGGLTEPGPFDSTMALLRTGVMHRHGITTIGVAGHPEGSPDITPDALAQALAEKNAYADQTGAALRIVTQFTFDPAPMVAWEQTLRVHGNRLPIHVGLPGAASIPTLLRFGLRCGIGPSMTVLRKQGGRLLKLASPTAHYPDATVVGIARACAEDPDALFGAFHYFPFGALDRTVTWASDLRRGTFRIDDDGRLLTAERPG